MRVLNSDEANKIYPKPKSTIISRMILTPIEYNIYFSYVLKYHQETTPN